MVGKVLKSKRSLSYQLENHFEMILSFTLVLLQDGQDVSTPTFFLSPQKNCLPSKALAKT